MALTVAPGYLVRPGSRRPGCSTGARGAVSARSSWSTCRHETRRADEETHDGRRPPGAGVNRDRAPRARAGNAGALADGVISADCRTARSSTCRPCRIAHDAVTERGPEIVDGTPVVVTMATSRIEAELIVGLLRSHGLRAAVSADDAGGQEPQLQLQGVRVLVARADEDAALQLLATVNDDHALAQERAVEPGDTEASAGS
jgi:hypothetical protein